MAVKIRLARRGRKKMAMYDIVIAESTSPRDGRFIEKIGSYNPNTDPSTVVLKSERAVYWLMVGATPTDTARSVLSHEGIMYRKHLQVGVNKGAITQEQADEKYTIWNDDKQNRKESTADTKTQNKEQTRAARLDAEKKVNDARAEAIVKKNTVPEAVAPVAVVAAPVALVEETPIAEVVVETPAAAVEPAPVVEETPVTEVAPVTEEMPVVETASIEETPVAEETPVTEAATVLDSPVAEEAVPVAETPAPEATAVETLESETTAVQATAEATPATEVAVDETPAVETPVAEAAAAPVDTDKTKVAE